MRAAGIDAVSIETEQSPDASLQARWVPPSHVNEDDMTTQAVPWKGKSHRELQPVSHCNLPVNVTHVPLRSPLRVRLNG